MADRRSPDRAASASSCRETAARPCAVRSSRPPASAPAADAAETGRSLRRPSTPETYGNSGQTAPRPGYSRESSRWYSCDAGVPPASVDVVGSQKPPSVTPKLPLLLPLFTHATASAAPAASFSRRIRPLLLRSQGGGGPGGPVF